MIRCVSLFTCVLRYYKSEMCILTEYTNRQDIENVTFSKNVSSIISYFENVTFDK